MITNVFMFRHFIEIYVEFHWSAHNVNTAFERCILDGSNEYFDCYPSLKYPDYGGNAIQNVNITNDWCVEYCSVRSSYYRFAVTRVSLFIFEGYGDIIIKQNSWSFSFVLIISVHILYISDTGYLFWPDALFIYLVISKFKDKVIHANYTTIIHWNFFSIGHHMAFNWRYFKTLNRTYKRPIEKNKQSMKSSYIC